MIKLVASDMDGTLLGRDGRISERNAQAIRELQNRNVEFLICTGRSFLDASLPLKEHDLTCPMICMNGSAVYDKAGQLVDKMPLTEQLLRFILECCDQECMDSDQPGICFDFMTADGNLTISSEELIRRFFDEGILLPMADVINYEDIRSRFEIVSREEILSSRHEIFKMSLIHPDQQFLERVKNRLKAEADLAIAASHYTNLEITHCGAQKGLALLKYAGMHGISSREIMALGDSENDISMLSLPLGYTLAMENGMDSIKKTARCRTRSNDRDGVAYAIETMVLEPSAS